MGNHVEQRIANQPNMWVRWTIANGIAVILAILAVWVVFALAFYILASHQADQVAGLSTKLDSLYFAATTMLTIGYGDVHATGQLARGMVLVQMLFDVVFVAMGVSVLNAQVRSRVERGQGRSTQRNPR